MQTYFDDADKDSAHATFVLKGKLKQQPAGAAAGESKKRKAEGAEPNGNAAEGDEQMDEDPQEGTTASDAAEMAKDTILLVSDAKLEGRSSRCAHFLSSLRKAHCGPTRSPTTAAKARFESITTCQIYSLQAGIVKPASTSSSILAWHTALHNTSAYAQAWEVADRGTKLGAFRNKQVEDLLVSFSNIVVSRGRGGVLIFSGISQDEKVKQRLVSGAASASTSSLNKKPTAGTAQDVAVAASNKARPANLPSAPAAGASTKAASSAAKGKESSDKPAAKKGTLDFSKAKVKPKEKEVKAEEPAKKKSEAKRPAAGPKKGNARLADSDEDENDEGDEEDEEEEEDGGVIGYADEEMEDVSGRRQRGRGTGKR
jgi:hypothetical protein